MSQRMLFGTSREAEERRGAVFRRAAEVDAFLQSYRFAACDYCERGWFGTRAQPPRGVSTTDVHNKYMNFLLADEADWQDFCERC